MILLWKKMSSRTRITKYYIGSQTVIHFLIFLDSLWDKLLLTYSLLDSLEGKHSTAEWKEE